MKGAMRWDFPSVAVNGDIPVGPGNNSPDLPVGLVEDYCANHVIEVRRTGTISGGTLTVKGKIHRDAPAQDISGGGYALTADSLNFILDKPVAYIVLTVSGIVGGGSLEVAYLGKSAT